MAYVKNIWVDQEVERPKTYEVTNNQDGSVTLTDSFGLVTELGTPVNAVNMNHIEDGLADTDLTKYNATTTYNAGEWVTGVVDNKKGVYASKINNNVGNALSNDTYWEKVELGGGASRNIGEIVTSTIPLTDAGLHLLDGSLIQGNGVYDQFVSYMGDLYNTTAKTYNPSAFTVVGSPNITSDGVASGFSSSNYIEASVNFNRQDTIEGEFTTSSTINTSQTIFYGVNSDSAYLLSFGLHPIGLILWYGDTSDVWVNVIPNANLLPNHSYHFKIEKDKITVDNYTASINIPSVTETKIIFGKPSHGDREPFAGRIDLKDFSISVDGTQALSGSDRTGFCLESEWQQSVSTYGVCGKFVYEPSSNTVRLPKVTGIVEGTTDVSTLGDLVEAGLPNITGDFSDSNSWPGGGSAGGAFTFGSASSGTRVGDGGTIAANNYYGFDASLSSSVYGNSTTVQPQAIKVLYYIVIATSTKTDIEVDIDEIATDLNGKLDRDGSNAPNKISNALLSRWMPDCANGINITSFINNTYTSPANGYIFIQGNSLTITINNETWEVGDGGEGSRWNTSIFPVNANTACAISASTTGNKIIFYPLKGAN